MLIDFKFLDNLIPFIDSISAFISYGAQPEILKSESSLHELSIDKSGMVLTSLKLRFKFFRFLHPPIVAIS